MVDVQPMFDWLVDGAPGAETAPDVIEHMAAELRRAGMPLDRFEAFVRTLHPHVVGRSFVWTPERPVEVRENSWAYLRSQEFLENPVATVFAENREVRYRLDGGETSGESPFLVALRRDGFTDYFAGPLRFLSGETHGVAMLTKAPGGFTEQQIDGLRAIIRPLSRVAEILALRRTATNLLNTYVGHGAGERILAGQIQRGDVEAIRAVLWFSDLRGFTPLSSGLPAGDILRTLNDLFDCQIPAIDAHGGETLKFIGDGLLAIFRLDNDRPDAETCHAALDAAEDGFRAVDRLNAKRAQEGLPAIRFGLALHVGEVAYGNVGGPSRLDFTCIGHAVNLAARLESLSAQLDRQIIVSETFAQLTDRPMDHLGAFDLKGIHGLVAAYAPVDAP
jgi:adenylate cyclase